MRKFVVGALAAAGLLAGSAVGAQAMPMAEGVGGAPLVETVGGGCGPLWYRDIYGICRPRPARGPAYYYGRPAYYYGGPVVVGRPVVVRRPVVYARPVVVRRVYRRW